MICLKVNQEFVILYIEEVLVMQQKVLKPVPFGAFFSWFEIVYYGKVRFSHGLSQDLVKQLLEGSIEFCKYCRPKTSSGEICIHAVHNFGINKREFICPVLCYDQHVLEMHSVLSKIQYALDREDSENIRSLPY